MSVLAGNLTPADVKQALAELDELSSGEYRTSLEELLLDAAPRTARRERIEVFDASGVRL